MIINLKTRSSVVKEWNEKHPVGTAVTVRTDSDIVKSTKTRSEAWLLGGHTPVVLLEGVVGCYALDNVKPIVLCASCQRPIQFNGEYWEHTDYSPRHPATTEKGQ